MRKTFWILCLSLLFASFGVPRAQADEITEISVSNMTFDGNATCGPSSTSLCTLSISTNIEWDDTTDSIISSPDGLKLVWAGDG